MKSILRKFSRTLPREKEETNPHRKIYNPVEKANTLDKGDKTNEAAEQKESEEASFESTKSMAEVESSDADLRIARENLSQPMLEVTSNQSNAHTTGRDPVKKDTVKKEILKKDTPMEAGVEKERNRKLKFEDEVLKSSSSFLKQMSVSELRKKWQLKQSRDQLRIDMKSKLEVFAMACEEDIHQQNTVVVFRIRKMDDAIAITRKEKEDEEKEYQDLVRMKRNDLNTALYGNLSKDEMSELNAKMSNGEDIDKKKMVDDEKEKTLKEGFNQEQKSRLEELTNAQLQHYTEEISLRRKIQVEVMSHVKWVDARKLRLRRDLDILMTTFETTPSGTLLTSRSVTASEKTVLPGMNIEKDKLDLTGRFKHVHPSKKDSKMSVAEELIKKSSPRKEANTLNSSVGRQVKIGLKEGRKQNANILERRKQRDRKRGAGVKMGLLKKKVEEEEGVNELKRVDAVENIANNEMNTITNTDPNKSFKHEEWSCGDDEYSEVTEQRKVTHSFEDLLKMSRSEAESRYILELSPSTFSTSNQPDFYLPDPSNENELRILIPKPEDHLILYNNLLIKLFFKKRPYKTNNLNILASKRRSILRSVKKLQNRQLTIGGDLRSLRELSENEERSENYRGKELDRVRNELFDVKMNAMKAEKMSGFFDEATNMMMDCYQTDAHCLKKAYKVVKATGVKSIERMNKKRFLKSFVSQSGENKYLEDKLEALKRNNEALSQGLSYLTDTFFIKKSIENLV